MGRWGGGQHRLSPSVRSARSARSKRERERESQLMRGAECPGELGGGGPARAGGQEEMENLMVRLVW